MMVQKEYRVIWHGNEEVFDKFKDALQYARIMTIEEDKFDTALIITRRLYDDGEVKISCVRTLHWIVGGLYELGEYDI